MNYYTPDTDQGRRWRVMAYWFATGAHYATSGEDLAEEFGQYVAPIVDDYANEKISSHGSIYSMWTDFLDSRKEVNQG